MTKQYLSVSYEDRDLAKRLGARWDPSVRKWYCTKGSALAKIFAWRAAPKSGTYNASAPETQMPNSQINASQISSGQIGSRQAHIAQNQNFELQLAG